MSEEFVLLSKTDIARMIKTLKEMDVRGYESMNRLVAIVVFLESLALQEGAKPVKEETGETPAKEG